MIVKMVIAARLVLAWMTALSWEGELDQPMGSNRANPEQFRAYLRLLAEVHLGPRPSPGLDASDLVQQTLLDAHRGRDRFRGSTESELAAWLRRLLACNVADAHRARARLKRDVGRERSLEAALEASSERIAGFLADGGTSPDRRAERHEAALRLADALALLPEANRRALVLRHFQGLAVAEIAEDLGRTPAAVAGLLKRGLAQLRTILPEGGV
jgi:RNA polymerase sigma-70 factor, ECF subfamily